MKQHCCICGKTAKLETIIKVYSCPKCHNAFTVIRYNRKKQGKKEE